MNQLKIKVCGLKYPKNQELITSLPIDYAGFIFYKKSKRYTLRISEKLPEHIQKVGVFVDAPQDEIISSVKKYKLDVIQLHGKENIPEIQVLREKLIEKNLHFTQLWKAINVKNESDLELAKLYDNYVDVLLLDAKGALPGGNGIRFDWNLLNNQDFRSPLMLSGGIKIDHTEEIEALAHDNKIWGVDINSGFEVNPGLKDWARVKRFVEDVKAISFSEVD